jgi:hypothetical protein
MIVILYRSKLIVWLEGKFEAKAQKQWETYVAECCSMTQIAFVRRIFVSLFSSCTMSLILHICEQ